MNYTNTIKKIGALAFIGVALSVAFFSAIFPTYASANTYAYVSAAGDVRSVVADNWMIAIETAPNRHLHSGVLLLKTATDFTIVGDDVSAF
jgi:hypothetical protein